MAVTCKWAVGYQLDVSSVTTDTSNVSDGTNNTAPFDTSTYVEDGTGGPIRNVTIIWDLGSASPVTRARFNSYYVSSGGDALDASNDGTTWVNAYSAALPAFSPHGGTGSWESRDTTSITSTSYRYWRLSLLDNNTASHSVVQRCGDFRLFDGSTEYVVGSSGNQTITLTAGIASIAALGSHTIDAALVYQFTNLQSLTGVSQIIF
jgi:hypothetical protein